MRLFQKVKGIGDGHWEIPESYFRTDRRRLCCSIQMRHNAYNGCFAEFKYETAKIFDSSKFHCWSPFRVLSVKSRTFLKCCRTDWRVLMRLVWYAFYIGVNYECSSWCYSTDNVSIPEFQAQCTEVGYVLKWAAVSSYCFRTSLLLIKILSFLCLLWIVQFLDLITMYLGIYSGVCMVLSAALHTCVFKLHFVCGRVPMSRRITSPTISCLWWVSSDLFSFQFIFVVDFFTGLAWASCTVWALLMIGFGWFWRVGYSANWYGLCYFLFVYRYRALMYWDYSEWSRRSQI